MNRDVSLFLLSRLFSMAGDSALTLAVGMWVRSLTGSSSMAGLAMAAAVAPQIVGLVFGSRLDLIPRKTGVLVSDLVSAIVLLALLLVHGPEDLWIVFLVLFVVGLLGVISGASTSGAIKVLCDDRSLPKVLSTLNGFSGLLSIVAPLAGAFLLVKVGIQGFTAVSSGLLLVGALAMLPTHVVSDLTSVPPGMGAGFRHILRTPELRSIVLGLGLVQMVAGSIDGAMYALIDSLNRPSSFAGTLVAFQGVGMIVGAAVTAKLVQWFRPSSLIATCFVLVAGCLVGICLATPSVPWVLSFIVIAGLLASIIFTSAGYAVQTMTPEAVIGRVRAASNAIQSAPAVVSIVIGALVVAVASFKILYVASAVACAATTLFLVLDRIHAHRTSDPIALDGEDVTVPT